MSSTPLSAPLSVPLSVVVPLWQDRPAAENVDVAVHADRLGYAELWIGEMATYDAFALGAAIGLQTTRIPMTLGPFAVAVRTPMTVAMGAASVADLTGREVGVALGTSSDVVVTKWHGRDRRRSALALSEHATATRALLSGERADVDGELISTSGYRLRLDAPTGPLSIAAFGPRAIETAARLGDRLLLNLITPATAARLCEQYADAAKAAGKPAQRTAAWVAAAVEPDDDAVTQLCRGMVGYLAAPGYSEMFIEAGFGDLVDLARSRPHPREVLAAMPKELAAAVGLVGSVDDIDRRIDEYHRAGIDDICIVPATAGDPAGKRTLEALAPGGNE